MSAFQEVRYVYKGFHCIWKEIAVNNTYIQSMFDTAGSIFSALLQIDHCTINYNRLLINNDIRVQRSLFHLCMLFTSGDIVPQAKWS